MIFRPCLPALFPIYNLQMYISSGFFVVTRRMLWFFFSLSCLGNYIFWTETLRALSLFFLSLSCCCNPHHVCVGQKSPRSLIICLPLFLSRFFLCATFFFSSKEESSWIVRQVVIVEKTTTTPLSNLGRHTDHCRMALRKLFVIR